MSILQLTGITGIVKIFSTLFFALIPLGFAEGGSGGDAGDGDGEDGNEGGGKNGDEGDGDKDTDEEKVSKAEFDKKSKELQKAEKELKKLKDAQEKASQESLKEEGKYKELSEQQEKKIKDLEKSINELKRNNAVDTELMRLGIKKNHYAKLFNYNQIEINDEGEYDADTVKAAVEEFKKENPELFGKGEDGSPEDGGGSGPGKGDQGGDKNYGAELAKRKAEQRKAQKESTFFKMQ